MINIEKLIRNTPVYIPLRHIIWGYRRLAKKIFIIQPTYNREYHYKLASSAYPIRNISLALALKSIQKDGINGALAEAGVYRGDSSKVIHECLSQRTLYLFDTFSGFPDKKFSGDKRFTDTSLDIVKKNIGDCNNIVFVQGAFPQSTIGYEQLNFAFVLLDMDRYESTLDGLAFFYPRVSPGGYIFIHDYNSSESNYGVSKATDEFLSDKPECIVELPDLNGSVVIRKMKTADA